MHHIVPLKGKFSNGFTDELYLMSHGVLDTDHDDAGELVQDVVLDFPVGLACLGGEVPVGHTDGPQSIARHRLDHLTHHLVTVFGLEDARLALGVQDTGASERGVERERRGGGLEADINRQMS